MFNIANDFSLVFHKFDGFVVAIAFSAEDMLCHLLWANKFVGIVNVWNGTTNLAVLIQEHRRWQWNRSDRKHIHATQLNQRDRWQEIQFICGCINTSNNTCERFKLLNLKNELYQNASQQTYLFHGSQRCHFHFRLAFRTNRLDYRLTKPNNRLDWSPHRWSQEHSNRWAKLWNHKYENVQRFNS